MTTLLDYPVVLFFGLLAVLVAAVAFGAFVLKRLIALPDAEREDLSVVQTSVLTLLALLIGFSLSMAVNRFDQRKSLEENEANAIGTQYARADLIDAALGARMKTALIRYAQLRLDYYNMRRRGELARISRETAQLQRELWRLASQVAKQQPTPIGAIVTTGMNDVLNSQDYSEAARVNRIPFGAWVLMIVIAIFGCAVQGYGAKGRLRKGLVITVLPVTVALSLAFIADIDSPRGGFIRVHAQNLERLLDSLGQRSGA